MRGSAAMRLQVPGSIVLDRGMSARWQTAYADLKKQTLPRTFIVLPELLVLATLYERAQPQQLRTRRHGRARREKAPSHATPKQGIIQA
jgi:hypothetical protein